MYLSTRCTMSLNENNKMRLYHLVKDLLALFLSKCLIEGHFTPKIRYIFGKNPFVSKKNPSKIHENALF